MRIKKILYPTDYSACAHQAFLQAVEVAVENHAKEVHVLYVDEVSHSTILRDDQVRKRLHGRLDALTAEMRERKSDSDSWPCLHAHVARETSPGPAIVEYANDHEINLIVMGTHGRTGLNRLFMGSVAEFVIREAPCSVLTVHGRELEQTARPVRRVLVPVDFSGHTPAVVSHAKKMAEAGNARVDLLHVVEDIVFPGVYGVDPVNVASINVRDSSRTRLVRLADGLKLQKHCSHVRAGTAWKEIVEFASWNESDLIVIGSRGLSSLERLFLGSVAENVVRRAPCPVLVVRENTRPAVGDDGKLTVSGRSEDPSTENKSRSVFSEPPELFSGYL